VAPFLLKEIDMRWSSRRDGAVAVYDDLGTGDDMLVVEPIITDFFTPVNGNGRCACGAPLSLRRLAEGAELGCHRCHRVHGFIGVGTRVHR
jgi:hypothetical protein